jgi:hypothetical protein
MSITPPAWRMYPGKRATMHALDGSDAASLAPQELREAERALAALEQLLELNGERDVAPVDIFLVDPVADPTGTAPAPAAGLHAAGSPAPAADGDAIVRVVQPEAAGGEPLGWSLVRQLIPRWFGPKAAAATLVIDGIAGVVAGRIGTGPSIEAADEWVRAGLAAGRSIFLFGPRTDEGTGESTGRAEADGDRAATSFVSYLLATFGSAALRRFLAEYDPERRDHAALVAYQRPLGALEESWLSGLRERSTGAALRSFLRHLAPLVRPYRLRYLEILGYMLFELAYGLALPLASGYLVDNVLPGGDRVRLASFILVLLAIYVLDALVGMRRV